MNKRWGKGTVVIPAPKEVDEIMKNVPYRDKTCFHQARNGRKRKLNFREDRTQSDAPG